MAGALPRAGVVAGGLAAQQATSWLPAGHLPAASRLQPATIQCRIVIPGRCRGWRCCQTPATGHQLAGSQPQATASRIIIPGWCCGWWGPMQPAKPARLVLLAGTGRYYRLVLFAATGWYYWLVLLVSTGWYYWLVLLAGYTGWCYWLVILADITGWYWLVLADDTGDTG